MQLTTRTASAVLSMAVAASVAAGPALMQPASADSTMARSTSVTSECADAQTAWALAKSTQARSHRVLVKARKALRKARHTHHASAIRKAKRHVKRAKHRYVVRTHNERVQAARVGYACSAPASSARAAGTGMELGLLSIATGSVGKVVDLSTLTSLLDTVLPGVTDHLDAGQMSALLSGFNAGTPSLDELEVLLGSSFSPEDLQALLAGTAASGVVEALAQHIIEQLSGLTGGAVPPTDPSQLPALVATLTGVLGGLTGGGTDGTGGGGTVCVLIICL
jgi:hypothetical protein